MLSNIEIERKYFAPGRNLGKDSVPNTLKYFTSISHDRYYITPNGLLRLRDDERNGLEMTAKTYFKDNLHRTEINLSLENSLEDCLEFAKVAGWTLRLEFVQKLKIWITPEVIVSQTDIFDTNGKQYRFSKDQLFFVYDDTSPLARFIEIEANDPETPEDGVAEVIACQKSLKLKNTQIVHYSLIQLFGAYPRE